MIDDCQKAELYEIKNGKFSASVTNYGATLVSFCGPDKNGKNTDVCLGFDSVESYLGRVGSMGSVIGRFANRIEKGVFELGGKTYTLDINNGPNHIHGGLVGFSRKVWDVEILDENSVKLSLFSPDGDQGYPGNMTVTVTYSLDADGSLTLDYFAKSDADTIINLTNHAYFNLNGVDKESDVLDHLLYVKAESFCEVDENGLANGKVFTVEGTPFDFRTPKRVGDALAATDFDPIKKGSGIDHNFCLKNGGELELCATVESVESGILMECYTDQPGVQIYTGNHLRDWTMKNGVKCQSRAGICLETQMYPNATTHKSFPSVVLKANQDYKRKTVYKLCLK